MNITQSNASYYAATLTAFFLLLFCNLAHSQYSNLFEHTGLIAEGTVTSVGYAYSPDSLTQYSTRYVLCGVRPMVGEYNKKCVVLGLYGAQREGSFYIVGSPTLILGERYIIFISKLDKYMTSIVGLRSGVFRILTKNGIDYVTDYDKWYITGLDKDGAFQRTRERPGLTVQEFANALVEFSEIRKKAGLWVPAGLSPKRKWVLEDAYRAQHRDSHKGNSDE